MNVSEPMKTLRNPVDGTKTETVWYSQDKFGSNLITDQIVPGV